MPGKLYMGLDAVSPGTQSSKVKVARAYCEGRKASADGLIEADNPIEDPKSEDSIAWDQGWSDHNSGSVDVALTGCAV